MRDMDDLFDNFENHLVPDEASSTVALDDLSYEYNYMIWFFRVFHLYMIEDALENPPMPAHHEILEEEEPMRDHAHDVLRRCRHIMELERDGIDR